MSPSRGEEVLQAGVIPQSLLAKAHTLAVVDELSKREQVNDLVDSELLQIQLGHSVLDSEVELIDRFTRSLPFLEDDVQQVDSVDFGCKMALECSFSLLVAHLGHPIVW